MSDFVDCSQPKGCTPGNFDIGHPLKGAYLTSGESLRDKELLQTLSGIPSSFYLTFGKTDRFLSSSILLLLVRESRQNAFGIGYSAILSG